MKNWKTSFFGTLASLAGAVALSGPPKWQGYATTAAALFGMLFSLFAKDANVTGGTVDQTPDR
jgi:hypothetical protein